MIKNYDKNVLTFLSTNKNEMKILLRDDLGRDPVRMMSCAVDAHIWTVTCWSTRHKLAYTSCMSHKTFKNVNIWEKEKSRHMDRSEKVWQLKRELYSVQFSVRTHRKLDSARVLIWALFRVWMDKYTQHYVKMSILESIHVNRVSYVLKERKQLWEYRMCIGCVLDPHIGVGKIF